MEFASDLVYVEKEKDEKKKEKKEDLKVTTNMLTISLCGLENDSHLATGEAVFCSSCQAVFNLFSKIVPKTNLNQGEKEEEKKEKGKEDEEDEDEGDQLWLCEFCGHINPVIIEKEEQPTTNEVDYILETPEEEEGEGEGGEKKEKGKKIFVMDVSGSMCATTEMRGECPKRILDNAPKDEWAELELEGFEIPKPPPGVWFLSRLQAIQSAISHHIDSLPPSSPCSLLSFHNEVKIHGDASFVSLPSSSSSPPLSSPSPYPAFLSGEVLDNERELLEKGKQYKELKKLKETREQLQKELWGLQSGGGTALGPAVAVAIGQAGETPGSSVLVATDGLANSGVGNLETANTKEQIASCRKFYENMAEYARERSVTVNVLSLASPGDNVNLSILGILNHKTGGTIDVVRPETAVEQVKEALKAEPIATHVSISLLSHRLFHFKQEEKAGGEEEGKGKGKGKGKGREDEGNMLKKEVGVVSKLSEIPFEFEGGGKGGEEGLPSALPFQVQIRYTKMDGTKVIRVITQLKKVTEDKKSAEENVNVAVLSSAVSKAATSLAAQGKYEEALKVASANEQMLASAVRTEEQKKLFQQYQQEFSAIDKQLQQQMEVNVDCIENDGEGMEDLRLQNQNDELSTVLWNQHTKEAAACCVM